MKEKTILIIGQRNETMLLEDTLNDLENPPKKIIYTEKYPDAQKLLSELNKESLVFCYPETTRCASHLLKTSLSKKIPSVVMSGYTSPKHLTKEMRNLIDEKNVFYFVRKVDNYTPKNFQENILEKVLNDDR